MRARGAGCSFGKRTLPKLLLAALPLLVTLGATSAHAEAPSAATVDADLARARALFGEGRALLDAQRWADAAVKFRQAATIKDTPGLRYHVALCEENQGHLLEAETEYLIARGLLADQPAEDVAELIDPALARVQESVPHVRLVMPTGAPAVRVELDGRVVDAADFHPDLRLNPGRHTLRVSALEREPFVAVIEARPAETSSVTVQLLPRKAPAVPAASSRPEPEHSALRTATLIGSATLSAAGLGVGIWGLVERRAAAERVDRHEATVRERAGYLEGACSGPSSELKGPCAELKESLDDQDRATAFAVGGLVSAVTGLAASTATLLFWREEPLSVSVAVAPEHGELFLAGRF